MGETATLASIVELISTFFTALIGWVSDVLEFVTSNPLLLIFVILPIVSAVIAIVRSWIPGNGV